MRLKMSFRQRGNVLLLLLVGLGLILFSLSPSAAADTVAADKVSAVVSGGALEGRRGTSRDGRAYYFFGGIPYGQVKKRFGMSTPAEGWGGVVRSALEPGPPCINSGSFGPIQGTEDCLTLDVYTPKLRALNKSSDEDSSRLPVMVWIYGGGFSEGDAKSYGGSYFMDQDVVLVLINYRLGALGFLNAGVEGARGNQGLKDQVLALKWVRDNIAGFSGDPVRVTLFGESAGSISVSLLTFSRMGKGLFHRAILQSGPAIMPYMYSRVDGPKYAKRLGVAMDCPTSSNMEYLVECLQKIDPKVLQKCGALFSEFGFDEAGLNMGPSYETYRDGEADENVFLDRDPYELGKSGDFIRVPVMMGLVSHESLSSAQAVIDSPRLVNKLKHQWGRIVPNMLYLNEPAEDPSVAAEAIKKEFLGVDVDEIGVFELENLMSERNWVRPFRVLAELYANHTPVYLYNFTQLVPLKVSSDPMLQKFLPKARAAGESRTLPTHASEIPYLFDMRGPFANFFVPIGKEHEDHGFSSSLISTWTRFAKTGEPGNLWGNLSTTTWPPISQDSTKILQIESSPKLLDRPESWERYDKFWKTLSIKEYGKEWVSGK